MDGSCGWMRAWLLPLVVTSACTAGNPLAKGEPSSACTSVDLDATECPEMTEVALDELIGACGSEIVSVDGEGEFGSNPAGVGDTASQWCCYPVHATASTCDYGRPYVSNDTSLVSEVCDGEGWCAQTPPPVDLPADARIALQRAWEAAAQDEHAAVAAFSRIALELLAFGAPAALVDATLQAAREEVVHARLGFALASRYAGAPRTAGAFPLEPAVPRSASLAAFAAATAREGCIGETVTVLVATDCLAKTTDPAVREALSRIIADENGHAALAWRTVRWAIDAGGPEVREAVAAVFADLAAHPMPLPERIAEGPHRDLLVAHGLPDRAMARNGIDRAVAEVVLPTAKALLSAPVPKGRERDEGARA